jgi:hypothetical protein
LENGEDSVDHLKQILVFQENGKLFKLIGHVKIDTLEKRGLIKFQLVKFADPNTELEKEFINQVYINIKNLYHEHTHHDGDIATAADSMLPVCFIDDDITSKMEIIQQFQNKIIAYHKAIKFFSNLFEDHHNKTSIKTVHVIIRQAKGEFIYALNFLNCFKDDFGKDFEVYENIFRNAIISIDTFSEEANVKYNFQLSEGIRWLTYILVALTVGLIVITIFFALREESAILSLVDAIHALLNKP